MNKQYIIQESNKEKREEFYEYIKNKYSLKIRYTKEEMITSSFPFVVDFKTKEFWICESITCCACASERHQILSNEEFKDCEIKHSMIE